MGRRLQYAAIDKRARVVEHREIENFDLRFDLVLQHRSRQRVDELRRILIDDRRKIDRAGCQRRHVRSQCQRAAAFRRIAPTTAGRELHDHAGAMLADAFLNDREAPGIRRGFALVVANMDVDQRRTRLESFVRAFDLFGRRDRHGRVLGFGRLAAGNGDADDAG